MKHINQKQRAAKAWPILTKVAEQTSTITYGEIGQQLGIHHRAVKFVLSEIQDYCLSEKLPPLTALIVNKGGTPGSGFVAWDIDDLERGLSLVYGYPWASLPNPFGFATAGDTTDSLAGSIINGSITPSEAYALVKVRSMAQLVFRKALIDAYNGQCAISNFASTELLEAAHIISWSIATPAERINPQNGILLSVLHHKLYDLGWFRILPNYQIESDVGRASLGTAERQVLEEINGKSLRLPSEKKFWPDPKLLKRKLDTA